jgi:aldose 1-epimerase
MKKHSSVSFISHFSELLTLNFFMKGIIFLRRALAAFLGIAATSCATTMTTKQKASVTRAVYGKTKSGALVDEFTLTNGSGHVVKILNYGGIVTRITVPDKNGDISDVVLGFDKFSDYETQNPFFGCITGRYANRIAGGKFTLDGKTYKLAVNNGPNHLHGGKVGFDKVVWAARPIEEGDRVGLELKHTSPDGDEGYPGALSATVTYWWDHSDTLKIDYEATTTAPTVVNLTNHTYFNLGGHQAGSILNHQLAIAASSFTPTDATSIPTGELRSVTGTPFDFRESQTIGARIDADDQQIKYGSGYDHNYVLDGRVGSLRVAATVYEPQSGRTLMVKTTEPGVQLYTANFMKNLKGKSGVIYDKRHAFCLETQHYPDSPNQASFPSTVLRPGELYRTSTSYTFGVKR